ncbi:hypothetical protein Pryu01_03036 [Paraliobacillus ryukyuensis]|uniref:Phage ABA sandwich domain-containing protein n=1 Tax=Paraliobacillus ryukyuensis TaxID=200904 RepID=A0A366DQB4_9BACI|nr:hypothetical protein [Paraliobacillus ryukyuensis]RBO92267.1 hypothetical protein DES48_1155 [Paraliobacillus ryukyuensis]
MNREIDRLVAEKIFNHEVVMWNDHYPNNKRKEDKPMILLNEDGHTRRIPNYSTRIEDAWSVVEKLTDWDRKSLVWKEERKSWMFNLGKLTYKRCYGDGKTPSLAICDAALKTVGIDIENE